MKIFDDSQSLELEPGSMEYDQARSPFRKNDVDIVRAPIDSAW